MKVIVFKKNRTLFALILLILLLNLVLVTGFSNITLAESVKFLLYQVFAIVIPGLMVVCLINFPVNSDIQLFAFSYAAGYILQIFNYYLLMPFHLSQFFLVLIIFENIIFLILLLRKKIELNQIEVKLHATYFYVGIVFAVLFIRFVVFFAKGIISHGNYINIYPHINDVYFYIENTVAAKYSFPIEDIRWLGKELNYHYFSNLQNAVMSIVTGINVAELELQIGYIQPAIMIATAVFSLFEEIRSRLSLKIIGVIAVLFTSGYEYIAVATWTGHLYVAPFGFDIGLALSIMTFIIVMKQIRSADFMPGLFFVSLIFMVVSTGTKGPCALVVLSGIGIISLVWLFERQYKKAFLYGGGLLVAFSLTYILTMVNFHTSAEGALQASSLGSFMSSIRSYPVAGFYDKMCLIGVPKAFALALLVVVWLFKVQPCIFLMCLAAIICIILLKKKITTVESALLAITLFGIFMVMLVYHPGRSEMYFIMTTFPFASAFAVSCLDKVWEYKRVKCVVGLILVFGICFGGVKSIEHISKYFEEGLNNLLRVNKEEADISVGKTLRMNEYEAYVWIRENTSYKDILLTNLFLLEQNRDNFITSAFTERCLWLDGYSYVNAHHPEIGQEQIEDHIKTLIQCYSGNEEAVETVRAEGVTYIIVLKEISMDFNLANSEADIVFENAGVVVYHLK